MKRLFFTLFIILSINIYTKPERAVSASQFTTEILLSIGAEKQLIGVAYMDNNILPELKEKFEKIPLLSNKYPSKEIFYSVNPDFLTGWHSVADPSNLGSLKELENNGVDVYFMKSLKSNNLQDVFDDILEYGKIFELEENAKDLVNKMQNELNRITNLLPKEKVTVFPYDSGTNLPMVVGGSGIGNTLIELAGGNNIFKDLNNPFGQGTWEKVLIEDPDIILIIDYGDNSYEKKRKYLKEDSPIKNSTAVKNNKFAIIGLEDISAGVRNIEAIKKMAKSFHNIEIR